MERLLKPGLIWLANWRVTAAFGWGRKVDHGRNRECATRQVFPLAVDVEPGCQLLDCRQHQGQRPKAAWSWLWTDGLLEHVEIN